LSVNDLADTLKSGTEVLPLRARNCNAHA